MWSMLLALVHLPALARDLPPREIRGALTLSPLTVTDGRIPAGLTLDATCRWTYEGHQLRADARGPCLSVDDPGPSGSVSAAPPTRVRLGLLPFYGPFAGELAWEPRARVTSSVGRWEWKHTWQLDPLSVLPEALDAVLKHPTGSPTVDLTVEATLGNVPDGIAYGIARARQDDHLLSRGARPDHGRGSQTDPVVEAAAAGHPGATSRARLVDAAVRRSGTPAWGLPGRPN